MDKPMTNSEAKPTGSTSGTAGVIPAQKSEQWTASKFKGTDVMGSDNQKIGDVSDILFDRDAKIDAYIVSVGGFLGIGSKEVALAPKEFQVVPGDNGSSAKLKVNMNKEQLQQAANFQYYKEPVTTSSNTSSAPRSGGTMR
jgi:sporulation protein YlmC with PRC-barrel domain